MHGYQCGLLRFSVRAGYGTCVQQSGICTKARVIGAERLSGVLDWNDKTPHVLFGDLRRAAAVGP